MTVEGLKTDKNPLYDEQLQQLASVGFEQIGDSDIFQLDDIVLSLDKNGNLHLFVDYDDIKWEDGVLAIRRSNLYGMFCLEFLINSHNGVTAFEKTINGTGGKIYNPSKAPKIDDFSGKTIEQQLIEAGFVKDYTSQDNSMKKAVFRLVVNEDGGRHEIIALTDNDKLIKLLKPVGRSVRDKMVPGTKVLGLSKAQKKLGAGQISLIKFQNDQMEFEVSSQFSGSIQEETLRILRELRSEELGLKPFEIVEEGSGFKIGGVNSSELIRKVKSINGQSIEQLERRMRPKSDSFVGFLGEGEKLLDVLVEDNDFVTSQGLTHQELIAPLIFARAFVSKGFGNNFIYKGNNFRIELRSEMGSQESPFNDMTQGSSNATITNLSNGEALSFALLVPDMVERYGFYEGHGTHYRLEPSQIIKVFPHLAKNGAPTPIQKEIRGGLSSTLQPEKG